MKCVRTVFQKMKGEALIHGVLCPVVYDGAMGCTRLSAKQAQVSEKPRTRIES